MTDIFGATSIPLAAPSTGEAVSDPALDVLLSFLKAAINADAATAWATRAAGETPPVREVFAHDPEKHDFVDRDVPALFLFRVGGGTYGDDGIDFFREDTTLRLRYVFPPTTQGPQAVRSPFISGLSKIVARALDIGRHPSWVVASDLADPDGLRLAAATSTSPQTLSGAGFDGALASETMHAARPVSITTTPAVGAYNVVDPVVATFVLKDGSTFEESLYLTDPNGGETIDGIWPAVSPVSAAIPAQQTTTGTIAIGYADSPEARRGSLVKRYAGLSRLALAGPGRWGVLTIPVRDDTPMPYATIDFDIVVQEIFALDKDDEFDAFADADDEGAGMGPLPVFIDLIHPEPDGEIIESAYFPDE